MSGLPSGYTQLEYIRSSGTQYINTGVVDTSNTTIDLDLEVESILPHYTYGVQQNSTGYAYNAIYQNNVLEYNYANLNFTQAARTKMQQRIADGTMYATINGVTVSGAIGVPFQDTILIFAIRWNNGNIRLYPAAVKLYTFSIKKSGTLVRNFIPCKNASGAVGLYDTVEGQFYANAGTGTFTAGPEIIPDPPAAPTGLQTVLAVVLQWAASESADRYDVYRDGAKLGSTETTQYVDTTPEANQTYVYMVKAVNGGGESAGTSITVYTKSGYFEYKPLIESANFP